MNRTGAADLPMDTDLLGMRKPLRRLARMLGHRNRFDLFNSGYLQSLGFKVDTIVDAGVDYGTIPLYQAFEHALFVLVDPHRDASKMLQSKPARYKYVNKALGAAPGRLLLKEQDEGRTSLLGRTPLTASRIQAEYEVEVTTLDLLLDEVADVGQVGIKLDAEGYELEIMKGLDKYRDAVQFVICEMNVRKRFIGSYQFSELIAFMLERNLLFFNFLNPTARHPLFYDVIFVQRNSHLLD